MTNLLLVMMFVAGVAPAQGPALKSKTTEPADDAPLQAALAQAAASGLPHRMLLAEHIDSIIEDRKFDDPTAFKIGVMAVLRHSDFSKDLVLGELYLRMLQQHVKDDILDNLDAAGRIMIDGVNKDWPRDSIISIPRPFGRSRTAGKRDQPLLKGFGAIRGLASLFVLFETGKKLEPGSRTVFTIEISKMADHFSDIAYRLNLVGRQVRLFNSEGEEMAISADDPITWKTRARTLELRIPLANLDSNLRSIAVRGSVVEPKVKKDPLYGPWVACPTGPVTAPTEMLIHFGVKRELPAGSSLPVAVALQEGLLMANSAEELSGQIKKDAYAWMELVLGIDEQLRAARLTPLSKLPVTAQLAVVCRYDGRQVLTSAEDYELHVAKPATLADLRGYAEVRGWLGETSPADLRDNIAKMVAGEFKLFDYPNQRAREQGDEFQDTRSQAYFVKGKNKLLCYRDVGVNARWKFLEEGFGLKGNRAQAVAFQRLLSIACGLPTLRAFHRSPQSSAFYTISFDSKKRKWFAAGAEQAGTARKAKLYFAWHKPWTRPERFEMQLSLAQPPPTGLARFFLEADYAEFSAKRLNAMLERGIPDDLLAKSILQPLRIRR